MTALSVMLHRSINKVSTSSTSAPVSGAGAFVPPALPAIQLTPSSSPTMQPDPMLNANRNIIPETGTAGGPSLSLAPAVAPSLAAPPSLTGTDWKALLKKWWPWIVLALLAVAVMVKHGAPSRRSSSSSAE